MTKDIDLIEYAHFFSKQEEALKASTKFKFTLYGGSVGSGKSYWLRWSVLYWLIRMASETGLRGIRAGIFCEDYPSLNDRHLSKVKFEFPSWLGEYNAQQHEFTLYPRFGGGVIAFRNLDDVSKYLSVEFAIEAVDEINRNPRAVFDMLRSRLRWPGIKKTKFLCACNPLGEAWVKNTFVKRMFTPDEKEQYEFIYVNALPTDNPHLPEEYFKSLESLPEAQRRAYLEGNWDAFDESMDEKGYLRLITDKELQASFSPVEAEHTGFKILGVDPAAGGDNSSIVLKSGNLQEIIFNQKLADTMDLVGVVVKFYKDTGSAMIAIDPTGVGKGVSDRLRQLELPVKEVAFGEKPDNDEQFTNRKAEIYWKQRQWMLSGGRLYPDTGWNEFEYVKYKTKDGKIAIQPKEELFRQGIMSPNCVDAACLTQIVTDSQIRSARIVKANAGRFNDKMIDIWRGDNNTPNTKYFSK